MATQPDRSVARYSQMLDVIDQLPKQEFCGACYHPAGHIGEDGIEISLGILMMPGRRAFRVCNECVATMWHRNQPTNEAHPNVGNIIVVVDEETEE